MKDEVYRAIGLLLRNDETIPPHHRQAILNTCRNPSPKKRKKLVTAKQASQILSCHPKTIYRYVDRGILHCVRYSKRKIRFDLQEIETFAEEGLEAMAEQGQEQLTASH